MEQIKQIENYFNAEKAESILFIAFGIIGLLTAAYLLFAFKQNFWRGLALPILLFSIVQIVIGTTIYTRSPKDMETAKVIVQKEPQKIETQELPRMEIVMKNFVRYRYFEITMMALGILLMFALSNYNFWKGLGLGLFIQCAILLSLDFFAEKRGHSYMQHLQSITQDYKNAKK
jgi:hypothetical protein